MKLTNSATITKLSLMFIVILFMTINVYADEMGMVDTSKDHVAKIADFINQLKNADSSIEEINVHATGGDGNTTKIASTTAGTAGTPSDPEDIDAIIDNKVVVISEGDTLDITVPMANAEGMPAAVAGITISMKNGLNKDDAKTKAIDLAKKIDEILVKK